MNTDYIKHVVNILFFAIFCAWVAMIVVADNPIERINAACLPAHQIQRLMRATGGLHSEENEYQMDLAGRRITYACLYYVVRFFYRDDRDVIAYLQEELLKIEEQEAAKKPSDSMTEECPPQDPQCAKGERKPTKE